jgi:NitT/TauT family transport system substrate-binding protein
MKFFHSSVVVAALAALLAASISSPASAQAREKCVIAWSHYTGWEPLDYMKASGLLKKWGDKYNVDLDITAPMDYVESMNQFAAKQFCAVALTNMDALTIPAGGGVDTTFVVIGDYSNGNDGILIKSPKPATLKDLVGKKIALVENTVSHYALARALEMNALSLKQVTVVNTSDSDIGNVFATGAVGTAVVTWNPILLTARQVKGAQMLFDSSRIPGEIIDGIAVHTAFSDNVKRAIVGAWFETMKIMSQSGSPEYKKAIAQMANSAGGTEQEFLAQVKTTFLFYKPADAVKFAEDGQLKGTMNLVRKFSADLGLLGAGKSADIVGIQFPDGSTVGDKGNIKLRFDTKYMKMAADGAI